MKRNSLNALGLASLTLALAASADLAAWDVSGDFRTHLYTENWRDTRDGDTTSTDGSAARFRLRLREEIGENCRFQTRFAATVADEGNDWDFYIRSHRDSGSAVNAGTATLDELFVRCTNGDGANEWRIGRMQSNLDLPHMASRSFDRSQASGVGIGWTDGIAYRRNFTNGWYADVMAQYNGPDGIGQTYSRPITFDEAGRVGFFGVFGSDAEAGPIFMRALSLTVYPDALAPLGTANSAREDYILGAFKMGAGWDLGESGRRLIAVGEIAHAFNTPTNAAMGLPGAGDVDAWGWQLGVDIKNIFPKHTMGLNYGQSDAGMLLSNDFRSNNELAEYRWQYQATSDLRFEFRARWRRDLERRAGADYLQRDRDIRLRATYKF